MSRIQPVREFPHPLQPDEKLYFLHIYKTAGTTLSHLLQARFRPEEVCPAHQLDALARMPTDRLGGYRLYWGHLGFKLADYVPAAMIHLTMLRDPVAHVLSIYQAARRCADNPQHAWVNRPGVTLVDFLEDERVSLTVRDVQTFTLTLWHEVWDSRRCARLANRALTPTDYEAIREDVAARLLRTPGPVLVERALKCLEDFAFVGLVERMDDSMRLLASTFGWDAFAVRHLNAAPKKEGREPLSDEARELIRGLSRLDAQVYAHAWWAFERRMLQLRTRQSYTPRHLAA